MSPACALALAGRKSGSGVYGKFLAVWLTRSATEGATSQQEKTHGKNVWKKLVTKTQSKKPEFHTGMVWKMQNSTTNPEAPATKNFKNKRES